MSIPHAASGELIDVRPLGANLRQTSSNTLVRAAHLEVFRFVLAAGKVAPDHTASGAITIQCLEGSVELDAHGRTQILRAGSMVYLSDAEPHAIKALEDSSLLVTVLLRRVWLFRSSLARFQTAEESAQGHYTVAYPMPFEAEEFAKSLMLHAQTEKEVSSPTAILIGEYIKREAAIILETQQTLREGHPSRELSGCFQP